MTGKLKIDIIYYDPEIILAAEMWGSIRLSYHEENQIIPLFHTLQPLDRFVRWYLSASPHIFAEPPVPFVDGQSYSETVQNFLDEMYNIVWATTDPIQRKAFQEFDKIYTAYLKMETFHRFAEGFSVPEEPIIDIVRRGDVGEISFAVKVVHPYSQNSPTDMCWIQPSPWVYTFDLQDFVDTTKNTIFDFLHEVQQNYINDKSKVYADKLAILALSLNHYPQI
jgi:hypothetical protein